MLSQDDTVNAEVEIIHGGVCIRSIIASLASAHVVVTRSSGLLGKLPIGAISRLKRFCDRSSQYSLLECNLISCPEHAPWYLQCEFQQRLLCLYSYYIGLQTTRELERRYDLNYDILHETVMTVSQLQSGLIQVIAHR